MKENKKKERKGERTNVKKKRTKGKRQEKRNSLIKRKEENGIRSLSNMLEC